MRVRVCVCVCVCTCLGVDSLGPVVWYGPAVSQLVGGAGRLPVGHDVVVIRLSVEVPWRDGHIHRVRGRLRHLHVLQRWTNGG